MLTDILRLFQGIGAFLIGMRLVSKSLSGVAGGKIEALFKKLGNNKLAAVGVGMGSAAVLQSSSATTVILLGLVNSGIVSLFFAFSVFPGALLVMSAKKEKLKNIGKVLSGVGLIFIALDVIKAGAMDLKNSPGFVSFFSEIGSPFLLILIGIAFTAVIQSSSALTGLILTLSELGIMPVVSTFYIIMGSNVGSCATAMLASVNGTPNMKRTALIHLAFNAIGLIIFLPFVVVFGQDVVDKLSMLGEAALVAYFHVAFNLLTTVILLPFVQRIANFTTEIIKDPVKP